VAGGGFSGVETVDELHELVSRSLKYFPRIARAEVMFKLVHSQEVILPEMPERLGRAAQAILERRGVEVILSARVRAASRDHVYLGDGRPIGVFETDAMLRCVGRPGYWAVGDCAGVPRPGGAGFCPPTAQFAIREARTCATNVVAAIDGRPMVSFAFKALGILASLGQRSAVAQILGVKLTGFVAWFAWRTIYLSKLPGFVRKLRVALDWTLDLFFPRDITQLQVARAKRLDVHHYEPGEIVVRKGQVGREFYVILRGEVEVVDDAETVIARLGPREVFGEKALLEDTPRTATVRARGVVEVLVMSRGDFRSFVASFPVLDDYFSKLLRERHGGAMPRVPRDGSRVGPAQELD
jgi:NADH:quinone reductase (non-electrogenic)